jgi:hypothetical protein
MMRKTMFVVVGLAALGIMLIGNALATPVVSATAETARGPWSTGRST